jgi:hypothetical protein
LRCIKEETVRNLSVFLSLFYGLALFAACSGNGGAGEKQDSAAAQQDHDHEHAGEETDHEHTGEEGHSHPHEGEQGEESGVDLALDATYDQVQHGARLILAYDADTNSFKGIIENTTQETLTGVRVLVHLSSGVELGPTEPADLAPGEKKDLELEATGTFNGWSAHPEVGSSEHDHEHPHEHG